MSAPAVEARNLSKSFQRNPERRTTFKERLARGKAAPSRTFWALRDASFTVAKGASLGLVGHNGSGKSTALKVLTGIYRPTSGEVHVNGSVSALLEVGAGFHPDLTGRENIRLNATILGFSAKQISYLMDQIIDFADIGDFIDSPIKHYSSGMYLRLGFAVAVMVRPEILIVDEVIAVGDEEFQRKCFDHLLSLRKAGTTMIIVSHGLNYITDLCDDALWLDRGHVRALGPAREITKVYLDEVNAREAARLGGKDLAAALVPRDRARRGSGQARVLGVEMLDEGGRAVSRVVSGKPVRFRVTYVTGEPVDKAVFWLSLEAATGMPVLSVNTGHQPLRLEAGTGHAEFRADPLLVVGGNYELKPSITAGSSIIDAIDDGFEVIVRGQNVGQEGIYLQPGQWEVQPSGVLSGSVS
ncbi:MAG: ABC transporter ATP-binding protein [Candidatus Nanopelagicales bacterium]